MLGAVAAGTQWLPAGQLDEGLAVIDGLLRGPIDHPGPALRYRHRAAARGHRPGCPRSRRTGLSWAGHGGGTGCRLAQIVSRRSRDFPDYLGPVERSP
jgi:hypothetical protein